MEMMMKKKKMKRNNNNNNYMTTRIKLLKLLQLFFYCFLLLIIVVLDAGAATSVHDVIFIGNCPLNTRISSRFYYQEYEVTVDNVIMEKAMIRTCTITTSSNELMEPHYTSNNSLRRRRRRRRRRFLSGLGSSPPRCRTKCGNCTPCTPVHVPLPPGKPVTAEYYPEAWRCKCGNRLFLP